MDLTVIIPTYNRANKILRVLESLDNQITSGFDYAVRVMDDGSKDNTLEVLTSYTPKNYRFHWGTQENTGPGGARNRMLEAVDTELVVVIGDDIIPAPNFLEAHRNAHLMAKDEKLAVLGLTAWDRAAPVTTVMEHIDGMGAQQFSYFYLKDGEYYDFRHFYTSNISIRTDFIQSLDVIFRPDFVKYGFEDIEVGFRLEKKGMRILYQQSALAFHDHFYSVRGFCRRQYNVGIAAQTFVDLHPEMRKFLAFERIDKYRKQSRMPWNRYDDKHILGLFGSIEMFEENVLGLLESYENYHVQSLDKMYISIFEYFYLKGLAHAMLKKKIQNRVVSLLAQDILWPSVKNFLFEANRGDFPVPAEANEYFKSTPVLGH